MDKYHIYEEIGKGEFSQIFKGRSKTKIEYVAIKRVDKNIMKQVVNEVQIMHKFNNPHILRFYDWYETRNNIWLIVEYCTGNDLLALITKDGHLPEESVRMFGLDILSGLKYLHEMGVLHCDLQPKNILIDEYGILKISDFKLARKTPKSADDLPSPIAADINVSPYLSPELLEDRMCSYASDLWALGCILYRLRRGILPFGDSCTPKTLMSRIHSTEPVTCPSFFGTGVANQTQSTVPSLTSVLTDLLLWMLEKPPAERINWVNICCHPFWGAGRVVPPTSLPPQPVFDEFILKDTDGDESTIIDSMQSYSNLSNHISNISALPNNESANKINHVVEHSIDKEIPSTSETTNPSVVTAEKKRTIPDLQYLLSVPSDSIIRPIVDNKSIELIDKTGVKPSALPYSYVSLEDVSRMNASQLEVCVTGIYKNLLRTVPTNTKSSAAATPNPSSSQITDRAVILAHILSISASIEIANLVLNTHFLPLLLRIMRQNSSSFRSSSSLSSSVKANIPQGFSSCRILAVTSLAVMLRYATYIQPPAPISSAIKTKVSPGLQRTPQSSRSSIIATDDSESILGTLVILLKDTTGAGKGPSEVKLRRRAIAAMGELLFYISSQEDEQSNGNKWHISAATIAAFIKCLFEDEDEPSLHYVAKTIENILAHGGTELKRKLLLPDIASRLMQLSSSGGNSPFQSTCAMGVSHYFSTVFDVHSSSSAILVGQPSETQLKGAKLLAKLFDKYEGGIAAFVDTLLGGDSRLQIAYLNIINIIFISQYNTIEEISSPGSISVVLRQVRSLISRSNQFLPALLRILEQGGTTSVRGKVFVCAQLLCRYDPSLLATLCERKFPQQLLKSIEAADERESSPYVQDTAMSMLNFAKDLLVHCTRRLLELMQNTIFRSNNPRDLENLSANTHESNPEDNKNLRKKSTVIVLEALRAIASLASFPTLRRYVIDIDASYIRLLSELLNFFPRAMDSSFNDDYGEHKSDNTCSGVFEGAIAVAIDLVSNLELTLIASMHTEAFYADLLVAFIECMLPAVATLATNSSVEVRVLMSSCLRRLLPSLLTAVESFIQRKERVKQLNASKDACLRHCVRASRKMLVDVAPVPQYALRLLVEVSGVSTLVEVQVATELLRCKALDSLIELYGGKRNESLRVSYDSQSEEANDPQVAVLLHTIFKSNCSLQIENETVTPAQYMLAKGLPASVHVAFKRELVLIKRAATKNGCITEVLGMSGVLHLLLDCLENASPSSTQLSPLENINSEIYYLLSSCIEIKDSPRLDSATLLELSQLQAMGCMSLSLHLKLFVEAGFRSVINKTSAFSLENKNRGEYVTSIFVEMLTDQSKSNDHVCGTVINFIRQIVKSISTMIVSSKLRQAVGEILSGNDLKQVLEDLSEKRDIHAAESARKLVFELLSLGK